MKRFHSMVSTRIPRKTLYYIDKLVREKIKTEHQKLSTFDGDQDFLHKKTLSPQTRDNDKILRETREMLNFMTPVKKSEERKSQTFSSPRG